MRIWAEKITLDRAILPIARTSHGPSSHRHLRDRSVIVPMMIAITRRHRWAWYTRHGCDEAQHEAAFRTTLWGLSAMLVFS
jgi:hypothetical protein